MATKLKPVDVAVVGLGAANGVAVLPLARAGLKIAALEAGSWMKPADFRPDEVHNNIRRMVGTGRKGWGEIPTFRTGPGQPTRRFTIPPMMNAVGGTSIHWDGNSWRFHPWDFKVRSETIRRYGASAIPAGSTVEDWPIAYDDLEPFYDTVEYEVGVSGKAGNLQGKIDPAGNIFEGPRKREYPMPPLRDSDFTDMLIAGGRKLGWHPHRGPAAINSRPYGGRSACVYHGFCDTGGCHVNAKNSTMVSTIPAAMKTKNLTIFERAHVTRIVSDDNGKVTGVQYIRDGQEYFQPAKAVLLGSYTYENVRLLLLSKSKAYPNGLSNNHGQVGKNYIGHWAVRECVALFPHDLNVWQGAFAQNVVVNDWADDNFDHTGLGFIGGASLTVNHEVHPIASAAGPTFGRAPQWGSKFKSYLRENAGRWVGVYAQCNTFPYENTYLDLDPEVKDPLGNPVCRITSGRKENEPRASLHAANKAAEWFRAAGAIDTIVTPSPAEGPQLSVHGVGGTRMGDDPAKSVVDKWGFSHEAPNLGIVSGSVMGTHGARNPTETIQALAWRTADHLVKSWKSIAG
ncbi:MAG TPA: GMC family oxidoreductase [Bryobacteraceae bacterium]|nr:GMC family oxidoreductase [Bryobacteraceae bacterium]